MPISAAADTQPSRAKHAHGSGVRWLSSSGAQFWSRSPAIIRRSDTRKLKLIRALLHLQPNIPDTKVACLVHARKAPAVYLLQCRRAARQPALNLWRKLGGFDAVEARRLASAVNEPVRGKAVEWEVRKRGQCSPQASGAGSTAAWHARVAAGARTSSERLAACPWRP